MIELKGVSKFYSDNNIVTVGLKNVNLKFNKGEFVAITGDSGSGKSTLLNVVSSMDTYDEGEILFYGSETFYFNQDDSDIFRKNNVSFIFQKYNIVDSYSVLQNVMLPLLIKGISEEEAKQEALSIIKKVGLEHRVHNRGSNLSGGEKQRCVIARALATDAPILACDEPTGNLDSKTSAEIIKLIKEVAQDKLVLVVTHDYDSVKDICTRKIKLSDGEIIEDVTFKDGMEEEKKLLVFKEEKPAKKTLLKLAGLNVFSTPKKTVFSSLVFTFVACIFLLLSLFMIQVSYNENYTYSETYGIIAEERMIIYADQHAPLDMDKLQSILQDCEYYENAFYEERNNYLNLENDMHIIGANAALTFADIEYELLAGESTLGKNEYVLIMPEYSYTSGYEMVIGEEICLASEADFHYTMPIGKLVGVGISNEVNSVYLMGGEYVENVANIMLNNDVLLDISSTKTDKTRLSKMYVEDVEKPYFVIPSSLKDDIEFCFNIKNIYNVTYDFDVVYSEEESTPMLVVNRDFLQGKYAPNIEGVKEVTVYTENVQKLKKEVQKLGYDVSVPSMVENNDGISLIVLYLLTIVVVVALLIMFYISFAILQRIYLTKTKDYSIFRTLGLVSNDLKKILNIEVLYITCASILAGALLTNAIIILSQIDLYKYVSVWVLLIYVGAMLLFGLLTANRLNGKIFKKSVYQSLKEGGEAA